MKTVSGVLGALLIAVIAVLAFGSSDRGEVGATEAPPALAAIGSSEVVSLVTPAPHSLEANPDSPVELVLTEALDPERFDPAPLSVFGRWSGAMTGSVELSDDGRRLRFDPGAPFHAGETVTASLRAGEQLVTGGAMETGFAWSFWIRPRAGSLTWSTAARASCSTTGRSTSSLTGRTLATSTETATPTSRSPTRSRRMSG